jgi:hypothetical protein
LTTAARHTTPSPPGYPLEGPRAAVHARSPAARARDTRAPGRGRDGPGTCRLHRGHCPRGDRDTVSPPDGWPWHAYGRKVPTCSGRDAAPVWCNPRRREETYEHPRAESEAGTRRTPVRWYPSHGDRHDHPSDGTGAVASSTPEPGKRRMTSRNCHPRLDIGSHINARHEQLPEAGAQQTLEAVGSMPLLDSPPQDP